MEGKDSERSEFEHSKCSEHSEYSKFGITTGLTIVNAPMGNVPGGSVAEQTTANVGKTTGMVSRERLHWGVVLR